MDTDEALVQRHLSKVVNKLVRAELDKIREKLKSDGFWYIDIPRTSSSSVRELLGKIYGFPHGKSASGDGGIVETPTSYLMPTHLPGRVVRAMLGKEVFEGLYSFSICRHPIDWSVSFWNYCLKYGASGVPQNITYLQFLKLLEKNYSLPIKERPVNALCFMQSDYLADDNGDIIVKELMKFEQFPTISSEVLRIVGKENWMSRARAFETHGMATRETLSQYEKDCARAVLSKDMEMLGYVSALFSLSMRTEGDPAG